MDFSVFAGMQYMLHRGNGVEVEETCRGWRFYGPLCETDDLRWLYLSLHGER